MEQHSYPALQNRLHIDRELLIKMSANRYHSQVVMSQNWLTHAGISPAVLPRYGIGQSALEGSDG